MNINQLEYKLSQRPLSPLFARLAHEYISLERMDEALTILKNGIERHTDYSTAYFALAECYLHAQNLEAALDAINHAIHMNPAIETLQQIRTEIQRLYEGSAAGEPEISEIQQSLPAETESVTPTITETNDSITAPDVQGIVAPAVSENIIIDSAEKESSRAETINLNASEELPQPPAVERVDESSVSMELSELLRATELDNLQSIPAEETNPTGHEIIAEEDYKPEPESGEVLPETAGEIEQIHKSHEETQVPAETIVTSELEEISTIGKSSVPKEPVIEFLEVSSDESSEIQAGETGNATFNEQGSENPEISVPDTDNTQEIIMDTGIEAAVPDVQPTQSLSQISETPEIPDASETTAEVQPELPEEDYRIVSKTLAEIYVSQGEYGEALLIYRLLKHQRPALGEQIDKRIEELEKLLRNTLPSPPQT